MQFFVGAMLASSAFRYLENTGINFLFDLGRKLSIGLEIDLAVVDVL